MNIQEQAKFAIALLTEPDPLSCSGFSQDIVELLVDLRPWLASINNDWVESENVQGFGVGEKIKNGESCGRLALRIYVKQKLPPYFVDYLVPATLDIPHIGEIELDVIEVGDVQPQVFSEKARPLIPGCGVSHPNVRAGTLGCIVISNHFPDDKYILSNLHVLANEGLGNIGDSILQPAVEDGGTIEMDSVAQLSRFHPLDYGEGYPNEIDAAIAKIFSEVEVNPKLRETEVLPEKVTNRIQLGDIVHIVGRTSGRSYAKVIDVNYRFTMRMKSPFNSSEKLHVGFKNQILCENYSDFGDSGALVLNNSDEVIGLHMAGSPLVSIFNVIDTVFNSLEVQLYVGD